MGFFNTYFELLQFIEIIYIANKCNQYVICLFFIPFVRLFKRNIQTAVSPHPLKIGHMYMNLFIWNSPYCHLLKYLLFLLKHSVCMYVCVCVCVYIYIYIYDRQWLKFVFLNNVANCEDEIATVMDTRTNEYELLVKWYRWENQSTQK